MSNITKKIPQRTDIRQNPTDTNSGAPRVPMPSYILGDKKLFNALPI